MLAVTDAVFTATHLLHLKQLADDAIAGPDIQAPLANGSPSLFDPLRTAYAHFATHKALFASFDANQPTDQPQQLCFPHRQVLESSDPPAAMMAVSKILNAAVNQKRLTQLEWTRLHDSQRTHLSQLSSAFPDMDKRLTHLAATEIKGPHWPLDLTSKLVLKYP
jgi:hypothetical protein